MPRVVHFEIPAEDPQRAAAFYKKAFGWKIEKWPGPMEYWMVTTGADGTPGINGGLLKKGDVSATTNTIDVDSVEKAVAAVKGAGGTEIMPKTAIPTIGFFAYCKDTEGNLFGVMQFDPNAK
jgi:uncharacterized protein